MCLSSRKNSLKKHEKRAKMCYIRGWRAYEPRINLAVSERGSWNRTTASSEQKMPKLAALDIIKSTWPRHTFPQVNANWWKQNTTLRLTMRYFVYTHINVCVPEKNPTIASRRKRGMDDELPLKKQPTKKKQNGMSKTQLKCCAIWK